MIEIVMSETTRVPAIVFQVPHKSLTFNDFNAGSLRSPLELSGLGLQDGMEDLAEEGFILAKTHQPSHAFNQVMFDINISTSNYLAKENHQTQHHFLWEIPQEKGRCL